MHQLLTKKTDSLPWDWGWERDQSSVYKNEREGQKRSCSCCTRTPMATVKSSCGERKRICVRIRRPFEGVGWGRAAENGLRCFISINHFAPSYASFSYVNQKCFQFGQDFQSSQTLKSGENNFRKKFFTRNKWGCNLNIKKGTIFLQHSSKSFGSVLSPSYLLKSFIYIFGILQLCRASPCHHFLGYNAPHPLFVVNKW